MSYKIPYEQVTFRPVNDVIPGNEQSETPVEFDLVPAEGPDRARIKSLLHATLGLSAPTWGPAMQESVIKAFHTGAPLFDQTVVAIRGLTVPAALALRRGLLVLGAGEKAPPPETSIPVINGPGFAKICGFVPMMAFHVAMKLGEMSPLAEPDARLFTRRSSSGGRATPRRTPSTAGNARKKNADAATAGSPARTDG